MNNVSLVGRLTKDVELSQSQNATIARFTLAVRRDKNNADFIPCVAFNEAAEILRQYTSKGSQIGISGRMQSGKYDNREGKTIYTLDCVVNRVYLIESRNEQTQQTNQTYQQQNQNYQQNSHGYQQPQQMSQSYQQPQQPQYHQMSRNDYAFEGFNSYNQSQHLSIDPDDLPF